MEDQNSPDFHERLAQSFADDLEELAQQTAEGQGQPMSTRKVSDARAVRNWNIRDQKVNPELMLPALINTGLPPELLDPSNPQAPLIIRERPELAQYYAQPAQTPQAAGTLVHWAEFPFRYGLVMDIDNPLERTRYSDHLARLSQLTQPKAPEPMSEPSSDLPPMPAATAPQPAQPSMPGQGPGLPLPLDPRMLQGG